jgi:hypothetical protein
VTPELPAGKTVNKEEILSASSSDRHERAGAPKAAQLITRSTTSATEPLPRRSAMLQRHLSCLGGNGEKEELLFSSSSSRPELAYAYKAVHPLINPSLGGWRTLCDRLPPASHAISRHLVMYIHAKNLRRTNIQVIFLPPVSFTGIGVKKCPLLSKMSRAPNSSLVQKETKVLYNTSCQRRSSSASVGRLTRGR